MCKLTAQEVQQDGATVAKAINNVAAAIAPTDPTLAAELTTADNILVEITSGWTTGTPVEDFNTAASAVEDILARIPVTAPVVPFVEIAVTAIDILLANVGGSPAAGAPPAEITVESVKDMQAKIATFKPNPFRGKVEIHRHHFQSPRNALKAAWNKQREKTPVAGVEALD